MLARASCRRVVSSMATKVYVRQASYESYGLSQALGTIHSEANYTRPNYATEQARHQTSKLCLMSGELPTINTRSTHPTELLKSQQTLQELFGA